MKTRFTSMGAAEVNRNMTGSMMKDAPTYARGTRERAPRKGVMDLETPTHLSGTTQGDGKRERGPVRGAKVSDIPA